MSENIKKRVRLIYGILLAVMLTFTGVLLMTACVNVYSIGDRPFTPENISAEFAKIAVIVWITVGLVIVGAILALILPGEKEKLRAAIDKKLILGRLSRRIDVSEISDLAREKLDKEKKLCKILRIVALVLIVAAAIVALVYALNFNNFGADYDASVIAACVLILPLTFFGMGVATAYAFIEAASIDRQIAIVKSVMAKSAGKSIPSAVCEKTISPKVITGIRIAVAAVALAFIVIGIFNGGMAEVLSKAINICTECIGLG